MNSVQLNPKISLTLIISFLLLISAPSVAQKKKKAKKQDEKKEVTQYERANAEYLLIEAQKFFILEDYQKSQAFLEQSLEIDSKNHAAYFKLAEIHFTLSDSDKGLDAVNKAISIVPDNKYYYLLSVQLYKQKNDFASAAATYELLIKNTMDYHDYLLDLVDVYATLNQYGKAISTIDLLEEKYGKNGRFTLQKVSLLLATEKTDEAIKLVKELIDTGTNDSKFVIEYANLVSSYRSVQEAIDFLESRDTSIETDLFLIQLYTDVNQHEKANSLMLNAFSNPSVGIADKLTMLYDLMNQPNLAKNESLLISLQTKLETQQPDNPNVYELTGELYWKLSLINPSLRNKFQQKAIDNLIMVKDLDPSDFLVWKRVFEIEYDTENWANLLEHSNEALDLFPNQGLFYFYNGAAQLGNDNLDEATSILNHGLKLASNNTELTSRIHGKIAEILLKEGNILDGFERFDQVLRLENSHPEVLNNYSFELALRKLNLDKALDISKHLMPLDGSSTKFVYTRGFVLFQADQFAQGESLIGSLLNETGFNADGKIFELYGDLLFKMNKHEEALEQWQKAKSAGGASLKLDQKIATKEYYE